MKRNKFAENIKELREQKDISQRELASDLKVSQRVISYWERGDSEPNLETLCRIANYFDVTVDYLVGRSDL